MRKYHRWLALLFGALLLFIAGTGLTLQALDIFGIGKSPPGGQIAASRPEGASPMGAAAAPAPNEQGASSRHNGPPRPKGIKGFITHLHTGEYFGPIGTALSILSGFALLFFAFSGLWMYVQMFRSRKGKSAGKLFW